MGADSSDNADKSPFTGFSQRMREAQASALPLPQAYSGLSGGGGSAAVSRPTQSDLEAIVNGKEATVADSAWDDPGELAVHALIHRAFIMELGRKGWNAESEIGSTHIKILRMAQAALRSIPKREPIA